MLIRRSSRCSNTKHAAALIIYARDTVLGIIFQNIICWLCTEYEVNRLGHLRITISPSEQEFWTDDVA